MVAFYKFAAFMLLILFLALYFLISSHRKSLLDIHGSLSRCCKLLHLDANFSRSHAHMELRGRKKDVAWLFLVLYPFIYALTGQKPADCFTRQLCTLVSCETTRQ